MNTQIEEIINKLQKEIDLKAEKGEKLVLDKEAEKSLYELINFQEWLNNKIEEIKKEIVNKANEKRKNFKGFIGEKLVFRYYKERVSYKIEDINIVDSRFITEIKQSRANYKKIEEYKKEKGELPKGIKEEAVPPRLEVKIRKYEENQIEPHID